MQTPKNLKIDVAVIPAAGLGTRLRPLTFAFPKEPLPVGRLPVLGHVVRELRRAGITKVAFIVSEAKPQIRAFFGDAYREAGDETPPVECTYIVQHEQHGLGHAVSLSRDWVEGRPFVVAFGDCIIESSRGLSPLERLMHVHLSRGSLATTLVEEVPLERVLRYGIVKPATSPEPYADELELDDIVEKPEPGAAPSRLAVAARWALGPEIFDLLELAEVDPRGEINLTDAVRRLKRSGAELWACRLGTNEARRDIGNFGTFFDAFIRAALRDPEFGSVALRAARVGDGVGGNRYHVAVYPAYCRVTERTGPRSTQ